MTGIGNKKMIEAKIIKQICDNCKGRFDFVMSIDYSQTPPYPLGRDLCTACLIKERERNNNGKNY